MKRDLLHAAVFLDLSKDEVFAKETREVFRKMAMERGARELEVVPPERPRREKSRRRRRRLA